MYLHNQCYQLQTGILTSLFSNHVLDVTFQCNLRMKEKITLGYFYSYSFPKGH